MRHLVVHTHLYQPPREDPWSEVLERQPSAAPFHDWNARVSDECYERLGGAAVRDNDGHVRSLLNLFSRLSFNIGPTLALWLERHRPEVLADALAGDRAAIERGSAGGALMQAYGHAILPLCEPRERRLQIAWGRADFEYRFGRAPRGIWLPETAVDLPTLEACADAGLAYTILAPEQVLQIRPLAGGEWQDVSGGQAPTHRPLLVNLPSGRSFHVFLFNGSVSRGVAFGGALSSGERFLGGLREALESLPENDGLVLLAADGETFGHHQRGAEEVLAEALLRCRLTGLARVSQLGDLLDELPAVHEARLAAPSAWSCPHGVGRWSRDCGCKMADRPEGWSWAWRAPLRQAVSQLRDRVFALIDRRGEEILDRPWEAAEGFGAALVRPRSLAPLEELLARHLPSGAGPGEKRRAAMLLELLRQTLFSATSCGWFFDDIAGIEATQVLSHAARAAELCEKVFGVDPGADLVARLEPAASNDPAVPNGAAVYLERARRRRREPRSALALHALRHLQQALRYGNPPPPVSRSFGLFAVDDVVDPEGGIDAEGRARVTGRGRVSHPRTLETWEGGFEIVSPAPGSPLELLIDAEPLPAGDPAVEELALTLDASRAASLLPAPSREVLLGVSWVAQRGRALAAPLPSPFPEAVAGGARGLLFERLHAEPGPSVAEAEGLARALEAAVAAGLGPEDLADIRPFLDRRVAHLALSILRREALEPLPALAGLLRAAAAAAGDAALTRARRVLVSGDWHLPRRQLVRLAAAAGLTADALTPLDTPVQAARDEIEARDDLA